MTTQVTSRALLRLFVPMALSSWLGTLAPPLLNAAIARAAVDTQAALAAYGVARNLAFLLSPVAVMVPTAVLVLVTGRASHRRLRDFLVLLGAGLGALGLTLMATPLHRPLLQSVLGLEPSLALRARRSFLVLVLYAPASIWRSFSYGLLIRRQRTRSMVTGGLVGFGVCLLGVAGARGLAAVPGEVYGAVLLVAATTADALVLHLICRRTADPGGDDDAVPTYARILQYFLPLVVTTWVMAVSRTVIDAGLARTPDPALALAAFSVAASVVFAFEAPVVMIRSAVLPFDHDRENTGRLRRFSLLVGAVVTAPVLLACLTPLGQVVLGRGIGLSGETREVALWAMRFMAPSLFILSWRQFNYGILMKRQRTEIIALSAVVRLGYLTVALFAGLALWPDPRLAAAVYTTGFLVEALITHGGARRIKAF